MISTEDAIRQRSSTRGYTEEKLTDEEVKKILEAGLMAPTATNRQEIHFTVVSGDSEILKELEADKNGLRNGADPRGNFYYCAPTVFFLSAETAFHWSEVDAGIAVQNMALMAEALGLGSVIIGCVNDALHGEKAAYYAKALAFPEGYDFKIALAVGHKKVTKEPHTYDEAKSVSVL
ncbi:MAG: nitroreductase family protein [Lachnospiraceae bacterium]|nr:nitroreductase family protein [Lachnospiraceae bacterium]